MSDLILESTLTCPECGSLQAEIMPVDAWQWYFECRQCHAVLNPREDDCCVFCSYGSVPCPDVQQRNAEIRHRLGLRQK